MDNTEEKKPLKPIKYKDDPSIVCCELCYIHSYCCEECDNIDEWCNNDKCACHSVAVEKTEKN